MNHAERGNIKRRYILIGMIILCVLLAGFLCKYFIISFSQNETESSLQVKANDFKIRIWSQTSELAKLIAGYQDAHPGFEYEIVDDYYLNYALIDNDYGVMLKEKLDKGEQAPDIYCVSDIDVEDYCQGEASVYAIAYDDLGIDCASAIKEAEIAPYIVDRGTNVETGKIMGLSPECNGVAFAYRRSIAKRVWGMDDPEVIADKIGPGWEQFLVAAEELRKQGYYIIPGIDAVLRPMMGNVSEAWFADGNLSIDPKREQYIDFAKSLTDNGYQKGAKEWSEEWMQGMSSDEIFGYFAPSWMIQNSIPFYCHPNFDEQITGSYGDWAVCVPPASYSGGGHWIFVNKDSEHLDVLADIIKWATLDCSDAGLQYRYANGEFEESDGSCVGQSVASGVVMDRIEKENELLGGQNMFPIYREINQKLTATPFSQQEDLMNQYLAEETERYLSGDISREQVILNLQEYGNQINSKRSE